MLQPRYRTSGGSPSTVPPGRPGLPPVLRTPGVPLAPRVASEGRRTPVNVVAGLWTTSGISGRPLIVGPRGPDHKARSQTTRAMIVIYEGILTSRMPGTLRPHPTFTHFLRAVNFGERCLDAAMAVRRWLFLKSTTARCE